MKINNKIFLNFFKFFFYFAIIFEVFCVIRFISINKISLAIVHMIFLIWDTYWFKKFMITYKEIKKLKNN